MATPLHRWQLTRKKGTPDQVRRDYFTYSHTKLTKRGKIVTDAKAEKTELKNYRLRLVHRGLAKASWNWAKSEVKKGFKDSVWERRKYDKRKPQDAVRGAFNAANGAASAGATAEIHNRLDHIGAACPDSAVREAVRAAESKLRWRIEDMIERFIRRIR